MMILSYYLASACCRPPNGNWINGRRSPSGGFRLEANNGRTLSDHSNDKWI